MFNLFIWDMADITIFALSLLIVTLLSLIIYLLRLLSNAKKKYSPAALEEIRKTQQETAELEYKLKMALKAGGLSVWSYLPETDSFDLADENTVPQPGMRLADVTNQLVPEDRERHRKLVRDIVDEVHEKSVESFRLVTPEGKIRWYEIYTMGVRNEQGKVYRLIGTQKDITDQKDKIQELKENKHQRDLLMQIAHMVSWEYDVQTGLTTSSGESMFFDQQIVLKDSYRIVAPEFREMYQEAFNNILEKVSDKLDIACRVVTRDNDYRWVRLVARVSAYDKDGNVSKLIGTREDITEQMKREQSFKNYIRRFDLAIQSSNIIQWDYDMQSKMFTRLYSDPDRPGTFIRKPLRFNTHPEDRALLADAILKIKSGEQTISNLHMRIMMEGDKEYRWVNVFGVPLRYGEDGRLSVITGLLLDITHIEKAEESNRMKTAFLANMSHEIRTPLNAIVGFSNLITSGEMEFTAEEKNEFLNLINTNCDLLLKLINDILDLSRIESGRMDFVFDACNLTELMTSIYHTHQLSMPPEVVLELQVPEAPVYSRTDRHRLTQVLTNFINNAVKFTKKGYIRIGYFRTFDGQHIQLYVEDTGIGIPKEKQKAVFDRFNKLDEFAQGTGLGLAICKVIALRLKGNITLWSEEGKGSRFTLIVPFEQPTGTNTNSTHR